MATTFSPTKLSKILSSLRVPLGQVVITAAIDQWTREAQVWGHIQGALFNQHMRADWGEVGSEDWASNNQALRDGGRLLSAYTIEGRKVWIITEADRSSTTILFPEDY